jgi:hypothetical protein
MRRIFALGLLVAACSGDPVSRSLGARCTVNEDCDDQCLTDGQGFPGGFCTTDCAELEDCSSEASCVAMGGPAGVCLFTCVDDRDCDFLEAPDQAWTCRDEPAQPMGMVRVCVGE